MKKIVIGRYLNKNSLIHKFNPLLKFLTVLICFIDVGFGWSFGKLYFYSGFVIVVMFFSKLNFSEIAGLLKPFRFLLIFMFLFQYMGITSSIFDLISLKTAFLYFTRFVFLIILSGIYTITTKPGDIVKALSFIIKPLNKLGIDTYKFSVSSLIAIRFIPFFQREMIKISDNLKKDKIIGNKKFDIVFNIDKLIFPLFDKVFKYSDKIDVYLKKYPIDAGYFKLPGIVAKDYMIFGLALIIIVAGELIV